MTVAIKPAFKVWNAPAPTTAAIAHVATGTSIKTMLQIQPPAGGLYIEGWGFSWDSAVGASSTIELIQTDVAATVTAHVSSGILGFNKSGTASGVILGTAGTGYTASAEGTIAATRVFEAVKLGTANAIEPYVRFFEKDYRPFIPGTTWLRIRATTGTTGTNMLCWIKWHE